MAFKKAERAQARLRMGLCGPSGSGKTYTALRIASGLCAPGRRVALADSERGSASLYAGKFDFDVTELPDFRVETYLGVIRDAEAAGYDVLILDSISPAWAGKDGLLEQVDKIKAKDRSGNAFTAWRDVTPKHHEFVEALLKSKLHIIATMRSKVEWVLENVDGKMKPRKVGLAPVQRDGMEYEFTIVCDLDGAALTVSKTRIPEVLPLDALVRQPGEDLGRRLAEWCAGGVVAPSPPPAPAPAPDVRARQAHFRAVRDAATAAGWTPEKIAAWVKAKGRAKREDVTAEDVAALLAELAAPTAPPPPGEPTSPAAPSPYEQILAAANAAGQLDATVKAWLAGNGVHSPPAGVTPAMVEAFKGWLAERADPIGPDGDASEAHYPHGGTEPGSEG